MPNKVSTKAVVCKCVSLALILLTLGLISAAYDRGAWYHTLEESTNYEQNCVKGNDERTASGFVDNKPCPPSWLIILSIAITSIALIVTIASLIMSFAVDPKEKNNGQIDFYLNLTSGILLFLAGCLAFIFIMLMVFSDYGPFQCSRHNRRQNEWGEYERGASNSGKSRHNVEPFDKYFDKHPFRCGILTWYFQYELLSAGIFFTVPAEIMLIITAIMVKTKTPKPMSNYLPLMMSAQRQQQQMSMTPSQQVMPTMSYPGYQQQPYYQQQVPVQVQGTPSSSIMQPNYQYQQQPPQPASSPTP